MVLSIHSFSAIAHSLNTHTHTYVRIGLEAARTDGGAAAAVGLLGLTNVNFVYMLNFRK